MNISETQNMDWSLLDWLTVGEATAIKNAVSDKQFT